MVRACLSWLFVLSCGPVCWSSPYWVSWEGNDFPENQGWTRVWGNWDGQYHGDGAVRTLSNGILTYDSLFDDGVYDRNEIHRPGQIDPGPGELFVIEWRVKIDEVIGYPGVGDEALFVSSDSAWQLGYEFTEDHIRSIPEGYANIPFAPGVFHTYRVTSEDMRSYDLYIDATLARHGTFGHLVSKSRVSWGDEGQGAGVGSIADWDYLRFGVTPEPSPVVALAVSAGVYASRRRVGWLGPLQKET